MFWGKCVLWRTENTMVKIKKNGRQNIMLTTKRLSSRNSIKACGEFRCSERVTSFSSTGSICRVITAQTSFDIEIVLDTSIRKYIQFILKIHESPTMHNSDIDEPNRTSFLRGNRSRHHNTWIDFFKQHNTLLCIRLLTNHIRRSGKQHKKSSSIYNWTLTHG